MDMSEKKKWTMELNKRGRLARHPLIWSSAFHAWEHLLQRSTQPAFTFTLALRRCRMSALQMFRLAVEDEFDLPQGCIL
jgi:hypothetical protein